MEAVSSLFDYLNMFLESFLWYRLISSVMNERYAKRYTVIAALGMFVLLIVQRNIIRHEQFASYKGIGTLVLVIYTLSIILVLFSNSYIEKFIWWGLYNFLVLIMELISILFLNLVLGKSLEMINSDSISGYVIFLCKLMMIPLVEMIIRKRKGKLTIGSAYHMELIMVILLNTVLLISTIFIFNNKYNLMKRIDQVILFIFGIVLLSMIYSIIIIFRLEKRSKEELATKLKIQQIEMEIKQNEDMASIMDKLRKLRHDMNNHIGLMKSLMLMKKYEELDEYINQIYQDVEIANELVIAGDNTLSVLINAKKALAKSKNIDFDSMVTTQNINMLNKDICTLLGNILDNAIEAADRASGKKYVELMIQRTNEGCIISCENSIGMKPVIDKGRFTTWKKESSMHGIGTENIKDIVIKYKGQINYDYDDEMFQVRVVMPV